MTEESEYTSSPCLALGPYCAILRCEKFCDFSESMDLMYSYRIYCLFYPLGSCLRCRTKLDEAVESLITSINTCRIVKQDIAMVGVEMLGFKSFGGQRIDFPLGVGRLSCCKPFHSLTALSALDETIQNLPASH